MKTARGVLAVVTGLGLLATACGQNEPIGVHARFGVLPQSLDACPAEPVPKPSYVDEVDVFRLKLTGSGLDESIRKDFTAADAKGSGALQLDGVPAGDVRNLMVSGLSGTGDSAVTLWRGAHLDFPVSAGKTAEVPVLMTKLSTMTCSRSPLASPRMFSTTTLLADGRVLVAGGFYQAYSDTTTGRRDYNATDRAEIYDPFKGTFTETGKMTYRRGLHQAALLGDGRVLIVGGTSKLVYDPVHDPFPLIPDPPGALIEIFDPASGTFSQLQGTTAIQPQLVFHTATALDDGRVLIAGGGTDVTASAATNKSILCLTSGSDVVCTAGPNLARYRIGHTATLLDDGRVFVWGGATDGSAAGDCKTSAVAACPEWFRPGQERFVAVDENNPVDGANTDSNVFFGTATKVTTDIGTFVVIAGGLRRDYAGESGTNPLLFTGPIADIRIYSPVENKLGSAAGNYRLRAARLFPTSTSLAWFGRAFIAGGYNNLTELSPSNDMEVYDFGEGGVQPDITAEGQPVLLRQKRGGATAIHVGASTVVVIGGEDGPSSGTRNVLSTAEIYTDKMEPQL